MPSKFRDVTYREDGSPEIFLHQQIELLQIAIRLSRHLGKKAAAKSSGVRALNSHGADPAYGERPWVKKQLRCCSRTVDCL